MPARNLAMEDERQYDQTDQEDKGQSLNGSDSFHLEESYNTIKGEKSRMPFTGQAVRLLRLRMWLSDAGPRLAERVFCQ